MPQKKKTAVQAKKSRKALNNSQLEPANGARLPKASRPVVPAMYRFPTTEKGLLEWTWARERLTNSHNYLIVTVRPDGRPHAMGMHGLWIEDAFYFGTGTETRKAKNLAANPHCIVINDRLDELIIVEGTAEPVDAAQLPKNASDASKKKYGWPMKPTAGDPVFKVTPHVAFAFPEKQIATAVTRWIFEQPLAG